jgi:hypothetical protein
MARANTDITTPIDLQHHPMFPPPRRPWEIINEIDHRLNELKYMAAFAAEISNDHLNGDDEGYFKIPDAEGNRLVFCCTDVQRRIDELLEFLQGQS